MTKNSGCLFIVAIYTWVWIAQLSQLDHKLGFFRQYNAKNCFYGLINKEKRSSELLRLYSYAGIS
ncbi:hypothetical protein CRN84_20110 [Budvicia aquatica]|uniref:Uncharacterized protein n=1 Tax=Budvicia aquatica TaxID=82979 RepID=A0A2C6DMB8_9GAMM|nr:hypothetical protein CRN84_20110 [Budvicia aquatica]